jgi:dimethylargininase
MPSNGFGVRFKLFTVYLQTQSAMANPTAIVREPGQSFTQAISRHPEAQSIDYDLAKSQHKAYVQALKSAGTNITYLETMETFPDGVFVEDTSVILKNRALICSMKEARRQGEVDSVIPVLKKFLPLKYIEAPATLDGGDVLDTGEILFVGLSERTNQGGIDALSTICSKPVVAIEVLQGLHLKSAVSYLGGKLLIVDPLSVNPDHFSDFEVILVQEDERYAANCLTIWHKVLMPAGFPRLATEIRNHGLQPVELDMSEFEKADGGITCLSLIIPAIPA